MPRATGPLLVYGPRSTTYDFGPSHPLTPRRFGPGISLLEALGARPGLAPEPATDEDLLAVHRAAYVEVVRRFSRDPDDPSAAGIGPGDDPAFAGMHEAAAAVAGGSARAMDAILHGDVEHAYHPGGGLHHAMPDRASGFCVYNDPALAISIARRAGLRVLYVDLDTHHGDGVQAIHAADPGVLTFSIHESGHYLFPGSGFADEIGSGRAAGTVVNVPLEPYTGESAWLAAVELLVPALAAAFGPDVVVSQHGADSHAWDPLAHLRVTTTAMGSAARLVDEVAHRFAGGRWLATGGGGYDVYRVVPRAWALTWLAGVHRDAPDSVPATWRDRWAAEAERWDQAPLPELFTDPPNAGLPASSGQAAAEAASLSLVGAIASAVVPALLREALRNGWWDPRASIHAPVETEGASSRGDGDRSIERSTVIDLTLDRLDRLVLAPRTVAPADPLAGQSIVRHALEAGGSAVGAVAGDQIVGLALAVPRGADDGSSTPIHLLAALGVAPDHRRAGLGRDLLAALVERVQGPLAAAISVAERDPVEPLSIEVRREVGRRLLERAGFAVEPADAAVRQVDPDALLGLRP